MGPDLPAADLRRCWRGSEIGEVWSENADGCNLPLLVKYIFTSDRLSIQVHANDAQALAKGLPRGKEEIWYILDYQPGAILGIGLTPPMTPDHSAPPYRTGRWNNGSTGSRLSRVTAISSQRPPFM